MERQPPAQDASDQNFHVNGIPIAPLKRAALLAVSRGRGPMIWVLLFGIFAILFGCLGFSLAIMAAKIAFYVCLALFVLSLIGRLARPV